MNTAAQPLPLQQTTGGVVCVTVTYGDRRKLLRTVIDALPAQGVSKVVVVDNGAAWPVRAQLAEAYGDYVDVVEMGRNAGSAPGYAAGLQRALESGAEFLFLLDDDNIPAPRSLSTLLAAHADALSTTPRDRLAVLGFRPTLQSDVHIHVPIKRINPRPSSFIGFHIFDIPYKIWRRTSWGRPRLQRGYPKRIDMSIGPYGGLLFHRDVIHETGLPNTEFVLYGDDIEWTYRLHQRGGRLVLVTDALIDDLESSWSLKQDFGSSFQGFLTGTGDFRAYYSMRNATYFFFHCHEHREAMLRVNFHVYVWVLRLLAIASGSMNRFRLLQRAMHEGRLGRLGMTEDFQL